MVHDSPAARVCLTSPGCYPACLLCLGLSRALQKPGCSLWRGKNTWLAARSPGALETWAPVLDLLLAFQLLELGEVASLASFSFLSLKSQGCSRSLLFKMSWGLAAVVITCELFKNAEPQSGPSTDLLNQSQHLTRSPSNLHTFWAVLLTFQIEFCACGF